MAWLEAEGESSRWVVVTEFIILVILDYPRT